jgi:hypothetical protein
MDTSMEEKKKKKAGLFARIGSRDDALKTVKDCSMVFFVIAALQAVLGFFIAPTIIIDAILFAVLAGILLKWRSRISAVLLLLLGCGALVMTVLNIFGITAMGGTNIILATIIVWAAIRAVEATFKLHGEFAAESS